MRILAVDTSRAPGSIALLDSNQLLGDRALVASSRTTQTLHPAIQELLNEHQTKPADIGLLAVTIGPGSFTGLRIGVMLAKTWSYATGCQVLGIDTLLVVAHQAVTTRKFLEVVLDAERTQLFAARFTRDQADNTDWDVARGTRIMDRDSWLGLLDETVAVSGEGLRRIVDKIPGSAEIVDREHWPVRAITLGQLAWQAYLQGRRDDPLKLLPQYYRPSAAEEKKR